MDTGSSDPACTDDDESNDRKTALDVPVGGADASAVDKGHTKTSTLSTVADERNGRIQELEKELAQLRPLKNENQRLRRCVGGVSVLGRTLTETKKELKDLRTLLDVELSTTEQQPPSDLKDQYVSYNIPHIMTPPHEEVLSPQNINQAEASSEQQEDKESVPKEGTKFLEDKTQQEGEGVDLYAAPQTDPGSKTKRNSLTNNESEKTEEGSRDITQESEREVTPANQEIASKDRTAKEMRPKKDEDGLTDTELQEADLTSVEALIKQCSAPTRSGLTGPISDVRSVVTVTEHSGSDVKLKLVRKSGLQMQVQELTKCNRDWERFWSTKKSEFNALQNEKDVLIRDLEEQLKSVQADATKRSKHHDQTLLTAKSLIDDLKKNVDQLQCEVEKERSRVDKLDQLNRNLAKQNQKMTDEISRLKEALERHYQQKASMSKQSSNVKPTVQPLEPRNQSPESTRNEKASASSVRQTVSKRPVTPPKVAEGGAWSPQPLKAPGDEEAVPTRPKSPQTNQGRRPEDGGRHAGRHAESVRAAHGYPVLQDQEQANGVPDPSLSRQELKEQLELFRQQSKMYASDFRKERQDRETAMDQLEAAQRQLNKFGTGHAEGHGHRDKPQMKARVSTRDPPRAVQGPTQEVYKAPPSPPDRPARKQKAPIQESKDVTVVQLGERTCQVVRTPNILIVPAGPHRLDINLGGVVEKKRGRSSKLEPFQCPRCQRLFKGSDWEAFDYHVEMCNV